jgi:hypothetical protein
MEALTQQLINYRREAEAIIVPEENLYLICWVSNPCPSAPTATDLWNVSNRLHMLIRLLGENKISTDDVKTLTGRWRQYIESYTSVRSLISHRVLPD